MGEVGAIKFYTYDGSLWCIFADGRNVRVSESDTELVMYMLEKIIEFYPLAYNALSAYYERSSKNALYYQYLIVKRFCMCNFGELTDGKDVDGGFFNLKRISCPMRGECRFERVVCFPTFNSNLSDAEKRVMKMYYDGDSKEEIADRLCLSPFTIKNHIKNAYRKTGVHDRAEFIKYASKNKIFE